MDALWQNSYLIQWNFPLSAGPPLLLVEKKNKTKNDLLAMKRILYDLGPLTLVRWPLWRTLKF